MADGDWMKLYGKAPDRRYQHGLNWPNICAGLTFWAVVAVLIVLALHRG